MTTPDAEPVVGSIHLARGYAFIVDRVEDGKVCVRRCEARDEQSALKEFARIGGKNPYSSVKWIAVSLDVWRKEMMQP